MGTTIFLEPVFALNILKCLIILLLFFLAAARFKGPSSPVFWLVGYIILAFTGLIMDLGGVVGFLPLLTTASRLLLEEISFLLSALILNQCLRTFLGKKFQLSIILLGLVLSLTLFFNDYKLSFLLGGLSITIFTWFVFFQNHSKIRQHSHRNRLLFWFPVLGLATIYFGAVYFRQFSFVSDIRLGVVVTLAYPILRHHVTDVRDMVRRTVIYIVSSILSMGIYIVGFLFFERILKIVTGENFLFIGAGLAVIISLIFTPLYGVVQKNINRLFYLQNYDPSTIISVYGSKISNILELNQFTSVAVGLIIVFFEIEKGILFLVDQKKDSAERIVFRLLNTESAGGKRDVSGELLSGSSITSHFQEKQTPLLQYDLDFSPEFIDIPLVERNWLISLEMEVFVPIYFKGSWIGLLAVGPKKKNRFTLEDLNLLTALASQTGIGLENARLVENLKDLNDQVRAAFDSLDRANRNLAKLDLTKTNFISIASHELRTPLTVARGYVEMLLEDKNLSANQFDLIKGIHKSILRQHEIMDSMFEIAQLDTRTLELQHQEVFINEIITSVVEELLPQAKERNQTFVLNFLPLPAIKADPKSLRKLFLHLIVNALKFTPDNGVVTISSSLLSQNNRDLPEGGIEIIVNDTGIGVDKEYQEIIFTKFYQPGELINRHSTGKTKFRGSGVGLGLALSRGIVEAHGGRIWVESSEMDEKKCPGSSFHVVLPLRPIGESRTQRIK
ncbi:MAG: GAF domain-containing sensor histidine kinase [Chloroflexota bacterium]